MMSVLTRMLGVRRRSIMVPCLPFRTCTDWWYCCSVVSCNEIWLIRFNQFFDYRVASRSSRLLGDLLCFYLKLFENFIGDFFLVNFGDIFQVFDDLIHFSLR